MVILNEYFLGVFSESRMFALPNALNSRSVRYDFTTIKSITYLLVQLEFLQSQCGLLRAEGESLRIFDDLLVDGHWLSAHDHLPGLRVDFCTLDAVVPDQVDDPTFGSVLKVLVRIYAD